jgi:hypothetical protein
MKAWPSFTDTSVVKTYREVPSVMQGRRSVITNHIVHK